jgi:hypothetical protein
MSNPSIVMSSGWLNGSEAFIPVFTSVKEWESELPASTVEAVSPVPVGAVLAPAVVAPSTAGTSAVPIVAAPEAARTPRDLSERLGMDNLLKGEREASALDGRGAL